MQIQMKGLRNVLSKDHTLTQEQNKLDYLKIIDIRKRCLAAVDWQNMSNANRRHTWTLLTIETIRQLRAALVGSDDPHGMRVLAEFTEGFDKDPDTLPIDHASSPNLSRAEKSSMPRIRYYPAHRDILRKVYPQHQTLEPSAGHLKQREGQRLVKKSSTPRIGYETADRDVFRKVYSQHQILEPCTEQHKQHDGQRHVEKSSPPRIQFQPVNESKKFMLNRDIFRKVSLFPDHRTLELSTGHLEQQEQHEAPDRKDAIHDLWQHMKNL